MSLTSYRAAPPRDPTDGFYNAPASPQRKLYSQITFVNRLVTAPQRDRLARRMSTGPHPYREELRMKIHKHTALLASLLGMLAAAPAEHGLAAEGEASPSF